MAVTELILVMMVLVLASGIIINEGKSWRKMDELVKQCTDLKKSEQDCLTALNSIIRRIETMEQSQVECQNERSEFRRTFRNPDPDATIR